MREKVESYQILDVNGSERDGVIRGLGKGSNRENVGICPHQAMIDETYG